MAEPLLADRTARVTYVLTKLAALAVAALLTWPLSRWLGPRAWWALAIFAGILAVMTAVVLAAGGRKKPPTAADESEDEESSRLGEGVVTLPVEDSLDLHPFDPSEIPPVVEDYLEAAHAAGFREVRLIHGRGIGVQRERVRSVLSRHPLVEAFHDAPPERGGWGATVAYLRDRG
ncbi:MAG: Smr/MutS family protein [Acidobacteria bacterium]|nr:Smr/MutS family protein [Acidobacteriota bacterium]